ncbi:MAG TPA: transketolase C-terminal domain-containing protein [Candidatus Methanoperedens sp.]|nr:transketolase C-terminal domain-containing protein [Candidatus Methanoperedens sp.]
MNSKDIEIKSIRQAFSNTLFDLAVKNPNIYIVDIGLRPSLYLDKFSLRFKSRFIECGIAESNAAAIAAGLAGTGKTVFLTSFACFSPALNWAVIKQSICYNHKNVKIVGTHAGLMSGDLGATHQMLEDIALMRSMPNMEVFCPVDAFEMIKMLPAITHSPHPAYLRLPRPSSPVVFSQKLPFTIGKSNHLKSGTDITVLGYGPILTQLFSDDFKKYSLDIINCSSIKPLDSELILKSIKKTGRCLVIEDHQKNGGLGDAVSNLILSSGKKCKFVHLAVNDSFGQSSKNYFDLYHHYGLSPLAIIQAIKSLLSKS